MGRGSFQQPRPSPRALIAFPARAATRQSAHHTAGKRTTRSPGALPCRNSPHRPAGICPTAAIRRSCPAPAADNHSILRLSGNSCAPVCVPFASVVHFSGLPSLRFGRSAAMRPPFLLTSLVCLFVSACGQSQPAPVVETLAPAPVITATEQAPPRTDVASIPAEAPNAESALLEEPAETTAVAVTQAEADEQSLSESKQSESSAPARNFVVGEAFQHQNLSIFPVTSRVPLSGDRFITLDDGLRDGTVEVFEKRVDVNAVIGADDLQRVDPIRDQSPQARSQTPSPQSAARRTARAPGSAQVNQLMVVNRADKPLYLMPG